MLLGDREDVPCRVGSQQCFPRKNGFSHDNVVELTSDVPQRLRIQELGRRINLILCTVAQSFSIESL